MKLLNLTVVLNLVFIISTVFSQAHDQSSRLAEITDSDNFESTTAQLDLLAVELSKNPKVRGYIIVYRSESDLPGKSSRLALRIRNYFVTNRQHVAAQVFAVDGGIGVCAITEIWVVPDLTSPPLLRESSHLFQRVNTDFTRKYDEHKVYLPRKDSDCGWCGYEDTAARLDGFASTLKKEPKSRAYIIAYSQFYEDRGWMNILGRTLSKAEYYLRSDPPNTARKILRAERDYLTKEHRIDPSRIVVINGGHRIDREVELWIVPPGAPPPNPSPNTAPKVKRGR